MKTDATLEWMAAGCFIVFFVFPYLDRLLKLRPKSQRVAKIVMDICTWLWTCLIGIWLFSQPTDGWLVAIGYSILAINALTCGIALVVWRLRAARKVQP